MDTVKKLWVLVFDSSSNHLKMDWLWAETQPTFADFVASSNNEDLRKMVSDHRLSSFKYHVEPADFSGAGVLEHFDNNALAAAPEFLSGAVRHLKGRLIRVEVRYLQTFLTDSTCLSADISSNWGRPDDVCAYWNTVIRNELLQEAANRKVIAFPIQVDVLAMLRQGYEITNNDTLREAKQIAKVRYLFITEGAPAYED